MAASLNTGLQVKVDGRFVNFKSVKMTNPPKSNSQIIPRMDIELTLLDGRIISDDGTRVEIIIKS